jgi:hypothetical protein
MPVPRGVSVAGVCRSDGNYRRNSGREDHEARDRGPHELCREALSEGGRGRGGVTSAPDCKEHGAEHAGGNQRAHSQYDESHALRLARQKRAPVGARGSTYKLPKCSAE